MKVRICIEERPGISTFLVDTMDPGGDDDKSYVVVHMRRGRGRGSRRGGWSCSCPNFQYMRQEDGTHCKHIKVVVELAEHAGGISKLPQGETLEA